MPVFALLHNLEEALTMPAYAPLMRRRLGGLVPRGFLAATEDLSWFYPALVIVTVIPVLVVWAALSRPTPTDASADRQLELAGAAHGKDVVTVILADFRGLDTLVEVTVVVVALLGVAALLRRGKLW